MEDQVHTGSNDLIPARIRLDDYPQLKRLAWQVHGTDVVSPKEALGIYNRNWRHLEINVKETRNSIGKLLDRTHQGEEIVISRRGKRMMETGIVVRFLGLD